MKKLMGDIWMNRYNEINAMDSCLNSQETKLVIKGCKVPVHSDLSPDTFNSLIKDNINKTFSSQKGSEMK